jgi:hypothetical protein
MSDTYKAILRKDRVEWCDDAPANLKEAQLVEITIPEEGTSLANQGQKMAMALEQLAAIKAVSQIIDPSAWQREVRKDRPLPDRDL